MTRWTALATALFAWGAALSCTAVNSFDDVVRDDPPMEPPVCEGDPCELTAPQCGCPTGQMCDYVPGAIECVAEGSQQLGEECTPYSCGPGLHCLQTFGPPLSCHSWCDSDADCGGARCLVGLSDGEGGIFSQRLCGTVCDPPTSSGCGLQGSKCALLLNLTTDEWYTACGEAGPGDEGAACADSGDCMAGHHCITDPASMIKNCRRYCQVAEPICPPSQTCFNFEPSSVVDGVIYGACIED
jgi:hypothetical protein